MSIQAFIQLVERHAHIGMRIAEVGVHVGHTTIGYLPTIEKCGGLVYAIDTFSGATTPGGHDGFNPGPDDMFFRHFTANVWPWRKHVEVLRGCSWEQARLIPDESLDICFIDADHRYSCVKKDIAAYLPKVAPGGILCGHDYDSSAGIGTFTKEELESDVTEDKGHPGVAQAVYEAFGPGGVDLILDPVTPPVWVRKSLGVVWELEDLKRRVRKLEEQK